MRALAVLLVVAFHYDLDPFTGGFIGVDIFFVISGYLISGLIVQQINENKFSFVDFYVRRFKRIFPALFVVSITTFIAGFFLLTPGDYKDLSINLFYSTLGLANFYFAANTGYFDQASELMPMLHMWSLSVEEQFYVFWPLALYLLLMKFKLTQERLFKITILLILVSFAFSTITSYRDPDLAFYLLPSRAWELAIGGMLVFVKPLKNKISTTIIHLLALGAILWSVFVFTKDTIFPGFSTLVPVLAAAALVWPTNGKSLVSNILAWEPFRKIGLVSYSLYLWHWPILVLYRHYLHGETPDFSSKMLLILLSVVIAFLSLIYIETPVRRARFSFRKVATLCIFSLFSVGILTGATVATAGLAQRVEEKYRPLSDLKDMWRWACPRTISFNSFRQPVCSFGKEWDVAETKVILWGDSHAEHMAPLLEQSIKKQNVSVILYRHCPPIFGGRIKYHRPNLPSYAERCKSSREQMLKALETELSPDYIVLSASLATKAKFLYTDTYKLLPKNEAWQLMKEAFKEWHQQITKHGATVIVIGDVPAWPNRMTLNCQMTGGSLPIRADCSSKERISKLTFQKRHGAYYNMLEDIKDENAALRLILPGNKMCAAEGCINVVNGEFIYRDTGHFRRDLKAETLNELAVLLGFDSVFEK